MKMSWRMVLVTAAMLLLAACSSSKPVELKPTGEVLSVTITATRSLGVWTRLPKSEYSVAFALNLGEDFLNFEDPTWWERYQTEVEQTYLEERGLVPVKGFSAEIIDRSAESAGEESPYWVFEVPSVEWLQANVDRGLKSPWLYATIDLPQGGNLFREVDAEDHRELLLEAFGEKRDLLRPVVIACETHYPGPGVYRYPKDGGGSTAFMRSVEDLQESGELLYRFADGKRYTLIQLPDEFMSLTAEDLLDSEYTATLNVEVYKK